MRTGQARCAGIIMARPAEATTPAPIKRGDNMRTARKVFDDHWDALMAGDMDGVLSDYAEDATFIRPGGRIGSGHDYISQVFAEIGASLDGFAFEQVSVTDDGAVVLLEWRGVHEDGRVANGSDTFVIQDGTIRQQTLAYWVAPS